MSSKTQALLKALMFIIVGIFMVYQQFTTEGKVWPIIGIVISVVLVIGYLKQAFNK